MPKKGDVCLRLLEIIEKSFGEVKYRLCDSIETTVCTNWDKHISAMYKHSDGWLDGGNKNGVDFEFILATPDEIAYDLGDNCYLEKLPGSIYLLCVADSCSFYYIESGIRHLEAGLENMGELALLLLANSPLNVYTPNRMHWDIMAFEWMGDDDEELRYQDELTDPEDPEEREMLDIVTKKELLEYYPDWVINPQSKLWDDKEIWESRYIPEPMRQLKSAISKYYECNVDCSSLEYAALPCPVAVWGKPGKDAERIMTRALDTMADMEQQSGHSYISPFVLSLDAGEPSAIIEQLKAYLDCVYWTGEFLTYLQGKIN